MRWLDRCRRPRHLSLCQHGHSSESIIDIDADVFNLCVDHTLQALPLLKRSTCFGEADRRLQHLRSPSRLRHEYCIGVSRRSAQATVRKDMRIKILVSVEDDLFSSIRRLFIGLQYSFHHSSFYLYIIPFITPSSIYTVVLSLIQLIFLQFSLIQLLFIQFSFHQSSVCLI